MKLFKNDELDNCDLIVDAIYEGGSKGNVGDDPINKIIPVGNMGGFRYAGSIDSLKYIVLYTSGHNIDWPDTIDLETGIFKYHGDNRTPGKDLHDTKKKGNIILKNLFDSLHSKVTPRKSIPPIFIFEKHPTENSQRSVQFKGMCVPGSNQIDSVSDLVALWKTSEGMRFQNYLAYFTILDIAIIKRSWLKDLNNGITISSNKPKVFKKWSDIGVYQPLKSKRTLSIRSVKEQLPSNKLEIRMLTIIHNYFIRDDKARMFEYFAAEIYSMTDQRVIIDEVTRGVVDGGKDAFGRYKMGLDNDPIFVEFALEAKCYQPGFSKKISTVGVKETSRLISRIRNRQFGVLVTTSAIAKQAYEEVREDKHPIFFISGADIINILIEKGINTEETLIDYLNNNFFMDNHGAYSV